MADEKKYTAREAALAVLQKAGEMLKESELMKAEKPASRIAEKRNENEIGTKFGKGEGPPGEIHPKEQVQGEPIKPGARVESQIAPQANPKEKMEGNNPPSGAVPGNGVMKLAHFIGHFSSKKKHKGSTPGIV